MPTPAGPANDEYILGPPHHFHQTHVISALTLQKLPTPLQGRPGGGVMWTRDVAEHDVRDTVR